MLEISSSPSQRGSSQIAQMSQVATYHNVWATTPHFQDPFLPFQAWRKVISYKFDGPVISGGQAPFPTRVRLSTQMNCLSLHGNYFQLAAHPKTYHLFMQRGGLLAPALYAKLRLPASAAIGFRLRQVIQAADLPNANPDSRTLSSSYAPTE